MTENNALVWTRRCIIERLLLEGAAALSLVRPICAMLAVSVQDNEVSVKLVQTRRHAIDICFMDWTIYVVTLTSHADNSSHCIASLSRSFHRLHHV